MTYDVKYCIQGNIRPRFTFAPFALVVNRRILNWAYSNVLTYLSLLTTMSRRVQEGAKPSANQRGRK